MVEKHGCWDVDDEVKEDAEANYYQNHYFWIKSIWYCEMLKITSKLSFGVFFILNNFDIIIKMQKPAAHSVPI